MLSFHRTAYNRSWRFDIDDISCERIQVSDSVAGLVLACKAARLNPELQEICKVASLLGFWFDEGVLLEICSNSACIGSSTGECKGEENSVSQQ